MRDVVHALDPSGPNVQKPIDLVRNYRTHGGVLKLGTALVNMLHKRFPGSCDRGLVDDKLIDGPKPRFCCTSESLDKAKLTGMLQHTSAVLLFRDDKARQEWNQGEGADSQATTLTVLQAKGLEYMDVIVVNFFHSVFEQGRDRAWRRLLAAEEGSKLFDLDNKGSAMLEWDLKLLYTAATRCQSRLYFVETKSSNKLAKLVFDWKQQADLAEELKRMEDLSAPQLSVGAQVRRACEFMARAGLDAVEIADREAFMEEATKLFRGAGRTDLVAKAECARRALSPSGDVDAAVACALECLEHGLLKDAVAIASRPPSTLTPHAKAILDERAARVREATSKAVGTALQEAE